jgi:hypothetical protein
LGLQAPLGQQQAPLGQQEEEEQEQMVQQTVEALSLVLRETGWSFCQTLLPLE